MHLRREPDHRPEIDEGSDSDEDGTLDVMVVPLLPEGDNSDDGEDNQNDSWMIQVCWK